MPQQANFKSCWVHALPAGGSTGGRVAKGQSFWGSALTGEFFQGRLSTLGVVAGLHAHPRGAGLGGNIPFGVCLGPSHTNQSRDACHEQ